MSPFAAPPLIPRVLMVLLLMIGCHLAWDVSGFQHAAVVSSRMSQRVSTTRWSEDSEKDHPSTTCTEFGFQSINLKPIIPIAVNPDDAAEVEARQHDEPMFTASVRRDLYNVMRNPFQPHLGAPAPLSWWGSDEDENNYDEEKSSQFGGVLLGKRTGSPFLDEKQAKDIYTWDTFAFTDRMSYDASACEGFTVLDDNQILSAIGIMGLSSTPHAIALTKAFEAWLTELAASHWGDLEASQLSVEFLIAFGNELTERLGVNHRILSTTLTQDEMDVLSEPQFAPYILPELFEDFQTSEVEVDEVKAQGTAATLWWDQDESSPEY